MIVPNVHIPPTYAGVVHA